jgi:hypothetical protein
MSTFVYRSFGETIKTFFATIALLCMCCGVGSTYAEATEAQPFEITNFTMEMTERTREVPLGKGVFPRSEKFEFVNEPYSPFPFSQAGGHPWALTTKFELATEEIESSSAEGPALTATRDPKDIVASLPPGLIGDPVATPRCAVTQITSGAKLCPVDTQVGVYRLHLFGFKEWVGPIINVIPEAGQSAEFALENKANQNFLLTAHLVRTANGEYGFTVVNNEIPIVEVTGGELTFWGVPAAPSHDPMRGRICSRIGPLELLECEGGNEPSGVSEVPFLTLPTDCSAGPETATLRADSWEEPGSVREGRYTGYVEKSTTLTGVTGCNLLQFNPTIETRPDTLLADAPVGLGVTVGVPQTETPNSSATPQLKDAVVTLPEGLSISPGIVDGIQACNESGPEGINFEGSESEQEGLNGELQLAPGHCPNASTVGTAEAITPLLPEPVKGHVYLARPLCGGSGELPCTQEDALDGRLYQLYLELGGTGPLANTGINIKAHGYVEANPATGQLTTKFLDNPQAPFSELHINLNGGPRAPLDNPAVCGPAVTTADFTPWSTPGTTPAPESLLMPGTPDATPSSRFEVGGCAAAPGLNPGFTAGTVTPQAGQFSDFTLNLSRQDREQYVKGIQVHTPPGLLGMLSSVPLCEESLANTGHCPAASRIGSTRVATGAGSHPFEIEGTVYLTTSYGGAPFGLSIVTNAVAGPFNLGLVVVRARINVDRETSTLTITTDETGPYAIPQIIFGVPLRLQRVTVDIDRPHFMFNPTNCSAQQITATISGSQEARANVVSPFAVGGCKSLAFKPEFKVSSSGHTSRANGASLDAKLSYPTGSVGNEANIARVKVDLPKQLPSRLTTLQKACTAATFASNPANCPSGSVVGIVRANTPLLPVELSGPVYFVSHGGEAFPSLIVVLQGDGVRVDLTGTTFISKAGITSSTFKTVPDVPVNKFELFLPQGKNSALAANGNLCSVTRTVTTKRKVTRHVGGRTLHKTVTTHKKEPGSLIMPTEMVAQNGAVLKESTKITVTGCPDAKAKAARTRARPGGKNKEVTSGTGRASK